MVEVGLRCWRLARDRSDTLVLFFEKTTYPSVLRNDKMILFFFATI